ncbi:MAG: methyltransferase domain-containing protein [Candidatus Diapherotrites archaeon]
MKFKIRLPFISRAAEKRRAAMSASEHAQQKKYAVVQHAAGPKTYSDPKGYDLLYQFAKFGRGEQRILDLMSGGGLVGKEIGKRLEQDQIPSKTMFVDITRPQLAKIEQNPNRLRAVGRAFNIPAKANSFGRVFCRYGIKNYQPAEQLEILKEIFRVTERGGGLVIQDMVSPSGLKGFMHAERLAKNLAGGDTKTQNNVPTKKEWARLLKRAGFRVEEISEKETSHVNTNDWVSSKQLTQEQLKSYFAFLENVKNTNPAAWKKFSIKRAGGGYEITYPLILIRAVKP